MRTLFVLIKCELGKAYHVARAARDGVREITELHSVSGQHDLLVKCEIPDAADPGRFVTERLQRLPGVHDTFTMITFKAFD